MSRIRDGRIEARTNDLVVLLRPSAASVLNTGEAAAYIAAVTNTETVLARAGIKSEAEAEASVKAQADAVLVRTQLRTTKDTAAVQVQVDKLLINDALRSGVTSAIRGARSNQN